MTLILHGNGLGQMFSISRFIYPRVVRRGRENEGNSQNLNLLRLKSLPT